MLVSAHASFWFLPFVLPVCAIVAFTDLQQMRIPNWTVYLLAAIYVIIGPFVLSLEDYGWQLLHLPIGIGLGVLFYAAGVVGAGDSKFAGAAAPFVALGDLKLLVVVFTAMLLAGFVTHRLVKYTPLRRLAPGWKSWDVGSKFPMGLCLGGTLVAYLIFGAAFGQSVPG
ncbi:prepilin peptidase [Phaeobacter sp.]|uniref:prepilin peptidase n=1 Tax=Phaeobacter sp. TaxID=1902409 RepID=UPI0025FDCCFC|nr:prepilin peptidase [Phaeobacter sp.]